VENNKLEKILGHEFKDANLLKEAVTHRSYLNENPKWGLPHNERLEFLGDAVLELIITEALFEKFPKEQEGRLTTLRAALVNFQMLASLSKKINLEKFLLMSRGEAKDKGRAREVILANAMEAIIGALYQDGGYECAKAMVIEIIFSEVDMVLKEGLFRDPKSLLQEKTQSELKLTPLYKLVSETGPDHKKVFIVGVYFGSEEVARGDGFSKQEAEVSAAEKALEKKGWL